ncbi:glycoside hydrolase 43 family protein [Mucilaginibacter sp. PAMB04274]|uniref:glycoside hydrolase family 43 protein n=1 Tax=Mucilaginibacter sp. PAMB04274 TaxID=3138568 RepID=UPI0031F6C3B3
MKFYKKAFLICFYFLPGVNVYSQVSEVWKADNGDGTYKNPIIHADYSDPDAIRVGDDYYMVSSSFNCMPGLPILHSRDLVNWTIVNYALNKQEPDAVYDLPQHGKGVWAPAIRYHKGEYFIYYPDPDYGIFMIKTANPLSNWSKPVLVLAEKGVIDPCPLWDEDGKVYLAVGWAGSRAGVNSLLTLYEMNTTGTKVVTEGRHVFDGHGFNHTVEGPKLYKRNGYYYIFAPAGGVATGWQLALRAKSIYGPFEQKVVLAQGKSEINGPHQGALVDTQTGESWFLHFQDKGAYGRVVHLQPVKWVNNWPVMGLDADGDGTGEPVLTYRKPNVGRSYRVQTPVENDEFNVSHIGLQWQWHSNPKIQWSALLPGSGYLRLFCYPQIANAQNLWDTPNLLLQKFPAPRFTATVKLQFQVEWDVWQSKKAGIIIMGNDYAYLAISKDQKGYKISQVKCDRALEGTPESVLEEQRISGAAAFLRVELVDDKGTCKFSYSEDGVTFNNIGKLFTAQPDKWIGAKVGLFSVCQPNVRVGGYADIDWFRIERNAL